MTVPVSAAKHDTTELDALCEFFSLLLQPLYVVVDAARDRRVIPLLRQSGCRYRILYGERLAAMADGVGPYLVEVPKGSPWLRLLLEMGWGNRWAMFIACSRGFAPLHSHLRRLLPVRFPDGSQALFRFYDPGVAITYLQNATADQVTQWLGPITAVYLEPRPGSVPGDLHYLLEFATGGESRRIALRVKGIGPCCR